VSTFVLEVQVVNIEVVETVEVHVVDIVSSFGILIGQSLGLVCIFVVEVELIDVPIVAMVGLIRRCQDRRGRLRQRQARLLFVRQLLSRCPLGVRLRSRRSLALRPFGIPLVRRLLVRRLLELKLILVPIVARCLVAGKVALDDAVVVVAHDRCLRHGLTCGRRRHEIVSTFAVLACRSLENIFTFVLEV
jgi:hypothetical protein